MVTILIQCSNISNYCPYEVCNIYEDNIYKGLGCISPSFIGPTESFKPFYSLWKAEQRDILAETKNYSVKEKILYFIEETNKLWRVDIGYSLLQMLALDCITLNEDRHLANMGLTYNLSSDQYSFTPIFDNGLSVLSRLFVYDFGLSIERNIKKVKAEPFTTSFKKQAKAVNELANGPILIIDVDLFHSTIYNMSFLNYNKKYVQRAFAVLNRQLNELEGIVWQRPQKSYQV